MELDELSSAVTKAVAANRIGRLVHVRLHALQNCSAEDLDARLSVIVEKVSHWYSSPLLTTVRQSAIQAMHQTVLGKFRDGETLLVSGTATEDARRCGYDLLAIGSQGTIRFEERSLEWNE